MINRDKIQAILFDLDGTLMDTDDQAVEKLAHRLQRLRWPRPHQTARRLIMASETPANILMTLLDMVGLDGPVMTFASWFRRRRSLHTPSDFRIMANAQELLTTMNEHYRLAVVTTRGQEDTKAFLDQHNLHDTFEVLVTRESTWRLKPHPSPIRHAAQLLDVPVESCVMVGDTTVDVQSARRAGAWAVAVLCGFGERKELERTGAHVILDHTSQLLSLL
ncbi:MAG: HAD family hydrolase [Chloroflexi bacterium]|nr:HAD family hydrolase [Chloroflexota bacterium]